MKKLLIITAALSLCACGHKEAAHTEIEADGDNHSGETLIELADEQAKHLGVRVDTVRPGDFSTVIRASGVIERSSANSATATAPTAGIVRFSRGISAGASVSKNARLASIDASAVSGGDSNRAAKAALDAARREVERLTPLYKEKLATAAEYNAAVAALEAAKAAYSPAATGGRATAPIGGVITELLVGDGAYVQAGDPIARIDSDLKLTLHAEVAADLYPQLAGVTDARIGDFTLSEHGGSKTGVSAENGYACVYFTFDSDGNIAPGAGAAVYLLGAPRGGVIAVPLGAITEQQGEHYVYLLHSPGHYEKQPVTLGASDGRRVEITSGLKGGEAVVTAGAMTVRLAESSGTVPEGHSHSH